MDKFKSNKSQKKSKLTYKGKGQVTNISSLPLTPQEISKRDARAKKFSADASVENRAWDKVVLRSRHYNSAPEDKNTENVFIFLNTREEQKKYHLHIKSLKKETINTRLPNNPNQWPEIIQSYRKLREAIIGENSKVDKFMINVYQESVEACLKAKEFSDDKLFDDELAKGLLTLVEKLYPIYTSSMDKLTSKRKKKMGLYYSYYLFYHLGINSSHLGQVLSACKDPLSGFFLEHPDVKLATQLCISLIHLQYVPFFLNLKACKPSQRLLLKVSVYKSIHLMF
ncbi:hypothetical protein DSO57_1027449 [Entomophthora muscae]|uniref:Uncharacterized protein n=1 Tax=Entomophthora muscae TaxID=34485 RepID=A0ACC2RGL4_9FUNG|nr:hypothetical protein DSO57_1027449 [Entomophthora muscae]